MPRELIKALPQWKWRNTTRKASTSIKSTEEELTQNSAPQGLEPRETGWPDTPQRSKSERSVMAGWGWKLAIETQTISVAAQRCIYKLPYSFQELSTT